MSFRRCYPQSYPQSGLAVNEFIGAPQTKKPKKARIGGLLRTCLDLVKSRGGGGGGSRTRVRKPSDLGSTCLARSIFSYQQAARGAGHTW